MNSTDYCPCDFLEPVCIVSWIFFLLSNVSMRCSRYVKELFSFWC